MLLTSMATSGCSGPVDLLVDLERPLRVFQRSLQLPLSLQNLADVVGDGGHVGMLGTVQLLRKQSSERR